jgi:squalene-hopene/tetraprenyl-beta-curcumene cyclase
MQNTNQWRNRLLARMVCAGGIWAMVVGPLPAEEPGDAAAETSDASLDEPFAPFSAARAADYLDAAALDWQQSHQCAACHTMMPYLMARPALASLSPPPPDARAFFEDLVTGRVERFPDYLPKDGRVSIVVGTAVALAVNDHHTTGRLHPVTRRALDEMWTFQREDGSWEWPYRDSPPIKLDEHYGVTLAAVGVGMAPDGYAAGETAARGLEGIRRFLGSHPPTSLHERAMLLWASARVEGLLDESASRLAVEDLMAAQREDGGWALGSLVANLQSASGALAERGESMLREEGYGTRFEGYQGRDAVYRVELASDGYATGFAIYVAREAGIPADDPRLRRGVTWLKEHQRASGRWFTHSIGPPHSRHLISNAGTSFAVLALGACGEID